MSFALFSCPVCKTETKVPCLIFSGNAEKEHSIDLDKLNRITFGDNSMVISSSKDSAEKSVELLYSLYHHLEIGDATQTDVSTGINVANANSNSRIYVDAKAKRLYLQSSNDAIFTVGVFDINGRLLLTYEISNGDTVGLETLVPGIYIAVATDGMNNLNLKFILN